ncbi:MAG: NAD-dependent epimerase/dehydratase family protein [Spirochaetes bacterium]|nr:NAD-dependent epimerase/dehydratase family protein [Spirochaetota bacterium]
MKMLVTGATGFIGSVLVRELVKKGHAVRGMAMPGEDTSSIEKLGVEVFRGDLTVPMTLIGICNGIDTVFHCAARVTDWGSKKEFYAAIYNATENLIKEAAGKASRFVYISSIAALGLGRHMKGLTEADTAEKSGVPYNDAKLDTEKLVTEYHRDGLIAATIVRPANVTGPGSVWVRDVVERLMSITGIPLFDGGKYNSSFVYVDSLVDGIVRAGTMDIAKGKLYHVRDDWAVTWKEYLTDLGSYVGKKPRGNIPFVLAWYAGMVIELLLTPLGIRPPLTRLVTGTMGRDNDVDNSLAKRELGWKTTVPYRDAMEKTFEWVREQFGARRG